VVGVEIDRYGCEEGFHTTMLKSNWARGIFWTRCKHVLTLIDGRRSTFCPNPGRHARNVTVDAYVLGRSRASTELHCCVVRMTGRDEPILGQPKVFPPNVHI
jgi:hypothetical protein